MPLPKTMNIRTIAGAVKQLQNKAFERVVPTAKGGEQPTLQAYVTGVSTYFTVPDAETRVMYFAESWVIVKLTLETAGPVSVGTAQNINPVLSGKGRLLATNVEYSIPLARGNSLYVCSEAVNRISFTVEPVPWAEQIAGSISDVAYTISQTVSNVGNAIVSAIGTLTGKPAAPTSAAGTPLQQMPTPRLPANLAPRLTPVVPPRKVR